MKVSLNELAQAINGVVVGDASLSVSTLSPIDNISPGSLVFADGEVNFQKAEHSACAAILTHSKMSSQTKSLIHVAHPLQSFIQLLEFFNPPPQPHPGIHPTAVIAEDVTLGDNISIGPFALIEPGATIGNGCVIKSHVHVGRDVVIGAHTVIHPHVTLYAGTRIGKRVIIHASSVVGSDGFGYTFVEGQHKKIPHVGHVVIGDDVEIGANTVIDRATLGETSIGPGTKIDNLVQIAHSVKLGAHNILCAFTGIAGSTTSGDHVVFAANVGVSDHVLIDDGVVLAARAGVPPKKHLKKGNVYLGNPARPREKTLTQELALTRLPYMRKHIKELMDNVAQLEGRLKALEEKETSS